MVRTTARLPDTGWIPKVIALDIDGTLLKWEEGTGASSEVMSAAVIDTVGRAYDAGAHIVLASGRSPHGMPKI
ncbi:MAG: HAD family hydrolase, partial [Nocardioides sp.]